MKKFPLALRISASLIIVATLLLSVFAATAAWQYRKNELKDLHTSLQLELKKLEISLTGALWYYDIGQMKTVISGTMQDPRITGIVVRSGKLDIVQGRSEVGGVSRIMPYQELIGDIKLQTSLEKDGEALGELQLFCTTQQLTEKMYTFLLVWGTGILFLGLLLVTSLFFSLNRIIITPINKLTSAVSSWQEGMQQEEKLAKLSFTGEVEFLRHSMQDMISQLGKRYRELLESEERFRILVNTIPDFVWLKDVNGMYLNCNKSFMEFVGKDEDEIIGKTDYDLFEKKQADLFRAYDQQILDSSGSGRSEEWVSYGGRQERILLDKMKTPLFDADGKMIGVLGVAHDMTARYSAEEERMDLQNQLSRMQKFESIGRLAGGIAHDFNNMLSVILGNAELIGDKLEPGSSMTEDLEEITNAAERSSDLTRQLLAFARKQEIHPRVVDLNQLVEGMTKMLTRLIGEDILMEWQPGENLWSVKMDPSQLDQVLVNLFVNARDAMQEGGKLTLITENVEYTPDLSESDLEVGSGEFVKLTITDTGCGMDEEIIEQIFDPFFTTKELGKGTGLGLSTVYGVVKQNGGFIEVISVPDKGTSFEIYIPRNLEKNTNDKTGKAAESAELQEQITILVVEDERPVLSYLSKLLTMAGFKVHAADGPNPAIELAEKHRATIDLVISDVIMPGMNGPQMMEEIWQQLPKVKCIYMSGYTHDALKKHNVDKAAEMYHFITKPFSSNELIAQIKSMVLPKK